MDVFSTITSPVFSELVILLGRNTIAHLGPDVALFETLCAMNEVRPFKLVFSLVGPNEPLGEVQRKLAEAIESVAMMGLLDFLGSPPTIRAAGLSNLRWETWH
jgi:hypothetical protein